MLDIAYKQLCLNSVYTVHWVSSLCRAPLASSPLCLSPSRRSERESARETFLQLRPLSADGGSINIPYPQMGFSTRGRSSKMGGVLRRTPPSWIFGSEEQIGRTPRLQVSIFDLGARRTAECIIKLVAWGRPEWRYHLGSSGIVWTI